MAPKQKPGRSKQDYGTPDDFLAAVRRRFLPTEYGADFDIDLAATRDFDSMTDNAVCQRCYTEHDNALVQPWKIGDGWNWLNPPFARIEPWVRRAYEQMCVEHASTLVLVPAGVGSNWWRDWVDYKARVLLLNGRLTFKGETMPYPKDCALLVYDRYTAPGYEVWDWRSVKVAA